MAKDKRGSQQHDYATYVGDQPVTVYRLPDTAKVFRDGEAIVAPWQSRTKALDLHVQVAKESQQMESYPELGVDRMLDTATGSLPNDLQTTVAGMDETPTDVWVVDRHLSETETVILSESLAHTDGVQVVVATERHRVTVESITQTYPHVRTVFLD
jgi:hypothetical protein